MIRRRVRCHWPVVALLWASLGGVSAQPPADRPLSATAVTLGPSSWAADDVRLTGTASRRAGDDTGASTLLMFGLPVELPLGVQQTPRTLTRRIDEHWSDELTQLNLFGRPLTVGGEVELSLDHRGDVELADDTQDDLSRLDQELSVDLYYPLSDNTALFVQANAAAEVDLDVGGDAETSEYLLGLDEAWLLVDQLFGGFAALQLGRQNIVEPREWWWDADLDAVRLLVDRGPWHLQAGLAERLARVDTTEAFIDPEDDDVLRVFARAGWDWAEDQSLAVFVLHQNDHSSALLLGEQLKPSREDERDADLWWLGLRALGEWDLEGAGALSYWLDAALVRGDETLVGFDEGNGVSVVDSIQQRDVTGWGADAGLSWAPPWPGEPTFTLAYAYGSGDNDPDDGTDRAFRQTGLENNDGRFGGVNRFNYYGELLRPELSNLHILTAAVGVPLWQDSSVELVYHRYRQAEASEGLDGWVEADPTGDSTDIGQELDLIVGIEEWDELELELIGSVFEAGDAYGDLAGERAYRVYFKLSYSF